jgi:hypothetical protein
MASRTGDGGEVPRADAREDEAGLKTGLGGGAAGLDGGDGRASLDDADGHAGVAAERVVVVDGGELGGGGRWDDGEVRDLEFVEHLVEQRVERGVGGEGGDARGVAGANAVPVDAVEVRVEELVVDGLPDLFEGAEANGGGVEPGRVWRGGGGGRRRGRGAVALRRRGDGGEGHRQEKTGHSMSHTGSIHGAGRRRSRRATGRAGLGGNVSGDGIGPVSQ